MAEPYAEVAEHLRDELRPSGDESRGSGSLWNIALPMPLSSLSRAEVDALLEELQERRVTAEARFEELDMQLADSQERHAQLDERVIEAERKLAECREQQRSLERQAQEAQFAQRSLAARRAELARTIDTAQQQSRALQDEHTRAIDEQARLSAAAAQGGLQDALALKAERVVAGRAGATWSAATTSDITSPTSVPSRFSRNFRMPFTWISPAHMNCTPSNFTSLYRMLRSSSSRRGSWDINRPR